MEQKKILITGASGFIGSTAVDKALELGYETWAGIRASSNRVYLQDERIKFIDLNYGSITSYTAPELPRLFTKQSSTG